MHELSVVMSVVDTVEEYLIANYGETAKPPAVSAEIAIPKNIRVTRVALEIGKMSSFLPSYVNEIWRFAVKDTVCDGAEIEISELPGKEFLIKEIEIEE